MKQSIMGFSADQKGTGRVKQSFRLKIFTLENRTNGQVDQAELITKKAIIKFNFIS